MGSWDAYLWDGADFSLWVQSSHEPSAPRATLQFGMVPAGSPHTREHKLLVSNPNHLLVTTRSTPIPRSDKSLFRSQWLTTTILGLARPRILRYPAASKFLHPAGRTPLPNPSRSPSVQASRDSRFPNTAEIHMILPKRRRGNPTATYPDTKRTPTTTHINFQGG